MHRNHFLLFAAGLSCIAALACPCPLAGDTVTVPGPLFDMEYEDDGFFFQTGVFTNKDGVEEPIIEQLGGYSIVDPCTIQYSLRPEETVPDPVDDSIWNIIPGGEIEVGGFPFFTTDMASDTGAFKILPKPGQRIRGVTMTAIGSFANPTEDASLLYSESLMAGGDSDSNGLSLGIFSSGDLPSLLETMFADMESPVDVDFDFDLEGQSSDPVEISFASISRIEFKIDVVPEPHSGFLAGMLSLVALMRRRKR